MITIKNYIKALFLPLLFGIFPLLFLYAHNAEEMLIQNLLFPVLMVICFAASVTALLGFVLKSFVKSSLISGLLLISYFSFGHIVKIIPPFQWQIGGFILETGHILFFSWALVLLGVLMFIILTKYEFKNITTILTAVGIFLVLFQVVQAGYILIVRKPVPDTDTEKKAVDMSEKINTLPDIYYIVVDAYGGAEILKEMYGVDNSPFITFLRENGFYVPDKSFSHYCQTIFSLGAVLNMNYIDTLEDFDLSSTDRMPVSSKLRNNKVISLLRSAGYSIAAFSSGYDHTEIKDADVFFKPSGTMSEFENVLLSTTMFPFTRTEGNSLFAKHRKRVTFTLDKIPKVTEIPSPKFVFAHIVSPHPPFVFDKDGRPVQQESTFHMADGSHLVHSEDDRKKYRDGYAGQVVYVTKLLKIMIEKLFERYPDEKPVIILQADHGPGSELQWDSLEESNLRERFSILNAYYLPGYEGNSVYGHISPVNIFRVVFNIYLGTRFELFPHKSYYTEWLKPYDFHDVTGQLVNEGAENEQR